MDIKIDKMKRKSLFILIAMLALVLSSLTGCRKYEQIRVTSAKIESIRMNGLKSVDLTLLMGIDNPAGKIVVKNAEGTVKHFGKVIGKVTLAPLVLLPRTAEKYSVEANVELSAGLGFKDLMRLADPKKWEEYVVDITFSGKAAGVAVKKNINDIPLKKLLESKRNEKV